MTAEMPHSDAAVSKSTGKNWDEWRTLLDGWGAPEKSHTEIAKYLVEDHSIDGWWAQGITVGYERLIGRRETGQRNDGSFSASVSKTINASAEEVHAALADEAQRSQWLEDGVVNFRTASTPKSVRFDDLEAGIIIAAFLTAKGDDKTSLQIQAEKLPSKEAGEEWKSAWKPRLAKLTEFLSRNKDIIS